MSGGIPIFSKTGGKAHSPPVPTRGWDEKAATTEIVFA